MRGVAVALTITSLGSVCCSSTYYVRADHLHMARGRRPNESGVVLPALRSDGSAAFLRADRIARATGDERGGLIAVEAAHGGSESIASGAAGVVAGLGLFVATSSGSGSQSGDLSDALLVSSVVLMLGGCALILDGEARGTPEASGPSPGMPRTLDSSP